MAWSYPVPLGKTGCCYQHGIKLPPLCSKDSFTFPCHTSPSEKPLPGTAGGTAHGPGTLQGRKDAPSSDTIWHMQWAMTKARNLWGAVDMSLDMATELKEQRRTLSHLPSSYLPFEWEKELGFLSRSPRNKSPCLLVQTNRLCAQQGCLGGSGMVCGIYNKEK